MAIEQYPYRLLATWMKGDPEAWIALGNLETRFIQKSLKPIVKPLYITGMARAGTTILTEAVALHPLLATHTYRDFPCLFTPYFWNRLLRTFDWIPSKSKPVERAHQDGIMVTAHSPEAMEEMLWTAFFSYLHDQTRSNLLTAKTQHPAFSIFYSDHIRKLLLARKRKRYAAKANYNLTRIPYLLTFLPDARFVIVVRHPLQHVWSSYRKDSFFKQEQDKKPATLTHMDQVGHYEFGKHRTLIHTGDNAAMASIQACFDAGDDLRGWARYWAMLHRFIADSCSTLPQVHVVRHEDLCAQPEKSMQAIFEHADLGFDDGLLKRTGRIFRSENTSEIPLPQQAIIREETQAVADLWQYRWQ
jgi:hypothetical protein